MKLEKELMMQSNNITLARYKMTEIQENVLICIIGRLQGDMTKDQTTLNFDDNRIIQINVEDIDRKSRNKRNVLKNIKDLQAVPIEFTLPMNGGELVDHCHSIITGYSNVRNTNVINVHLNKDIMPWLTYWGKNVGGTKYEQKTALSLTGTYTKRIYKLFCMNKGKAFFYMSIKYFNSMVGLDAIAKSNDNNYIRRKVLNPSIVKINASDENYDVRYNFFVRIKDISKKKQKADYIKYINKAPSAEFKFKNDNTFVSTYLNRIFPNEGKTKGKSDLMFKHLEKTRCVEVFAERLKSIVFEFKEQEKEVDDYRKLITFILNTDYGFNKKYTGQFKLS
jgi:hypothetical protein